MAEPRHEHRMPRGMMPQPALLEAAKLGVKGKEEMQRTQNRWSLREQFLTKSSSYMPLKFLEAAHPEFG